MMVCLVTDKPIVDSLGFARARASVDGRWHLYRLAGTAVVRYIGPEMTGRYMDEAHPDIAQLPQYLDRYRGVVETKVPSWRRGAPKLSIRGDYHTIENIVVPLTEDGARVDMLAAYSVMFEDKEPLVWKPSRAFRV